MILFISTVVGFIAAAGVFGSMAFFSLVMAPLIFIKLDPSTAGKFIRQVFPWYYFSVAILAIISFICLFYNYPIDAFVMGGISCVTIFAWQILMPCINKNRDLMLGGNSKAAYRFNWLHRFSVIINGVLLLLTIFVLARLSSDKFIYVG